jgi:hypothetical protein
MLDHNYIGELFSVMATRLGAPPNFIKTLNQDDDWNFVIKLCIFTEELCSNALVRKIGKDELGDYIIKLPLVGGANGKLTLLDELKIVGSETKKFITAIADIRNRYAHRIKYSNITLPGFFDALPADQRASLESRLNYGAETVDDVWGTAPRNSTYWRFVLESCFISSAFEITKGSGLLHETTQEISDRTNELLEMLRAAKQRASGK